MQPTLTFDPEPPGSIRLLSLAQWTRGGTWQINLAHDRAHAVLIWITRGQGVALLDGARVGLGAHNAVFVPARQLFSLDMGRQGFGQVLILPSGTGLTHPHEVQHLRIRDTASQGELTNLLDAISREQKTAHPLTSSAIEAYAALILIWLRRHMAPDDSQMPKPRAARILSRAFCALVVRDFASGAVMADHARLLGVSPTHLTRACKAETGKTAAALLTERQVHAARSLLGQTDVPAQDIARHLGFGSAAYFTRFMRHHTGKPPSALRAAPVQ